MNNMETYQGIFETFGGDPRRERKNVYTLVYQNIKQEIYIAVNLVF